MINNICADFFLLKSIFFSELFSKNVNQENKIVTENL